MLAKVLKKYNLTQSQVALKLGKSQQLVSKWCLGKCEPQINEVAMLCEKGGIPMEELLSCFKKPTK